MLKCWRESPTQRPTFEELVKEFDALLMTLSGKVRGSSERKGICGQKPCFFFSFLPFSFLQIYVAPHNKFM